MPATAAAVRAGSASVLPITDLAVAISGSPSRPPGAPQPGLQAESHNDLKTSSVGATVV